MIYRTRVGHVLRGVLWASAMAATAMPAIAQEQSAAGSVSLEEVVVTGSRIRGLSSTEGANPITVATAEDISLTKATSVEDVVSRMLAADFAQGGLSAASNNGGQGLSIVGLRGIGPQRTLVLVDGQRLIPVFVSSASLTDLNAVPIAMVEKIEVLRDGASSVYGADAIGGVINIITKKHADGVQLSANYGESTHGDSNTTSLSASIATNTEKGNVMMAVTWDKIDPLGQWARGWAVDPMIGNPHEGGSAFRSQLNTLQDENSHAIWIGGTQYDLTDPATAGLLPHTTYLPNKGRLKLNAGAWNYLSQGLDRKQISVTGHYEVAPSVNFVAEGFYTDRNSTGALRPEPLLGDTIANKTFAGFVVPTYAPGNTTGGPITAFLTPEQYGPRLYNNDSQTYRVRVGFEGTFGNDYHWEAGFVDQHNSNYFVVNNEGNMNALAQITGQINCIDVPGGCSPANAAQLAYNPTVTMVPTNMPNFFNGPYMFTPDQVKYLTWANTDHNVATQRYSYLSLAGSMFDMPAGAAKFAVGAEHRNEYGADTPDKLVQDGWGPNQALPTAGGYNVSSVYGEMNFPLFKNQPGAQSLNVDVSGRYDKYSSFGNADTWKAGLEWAPVQDVKFRGNYATGFRAPSIAELYGGGVLSDLTANGDPCDSRAAGYNGNSNVGKGVLTAGSTCSLAVANGAAVTNFQSANNNQTAQQQQVLIGGNPNLSAEKSKSYGYGIVLTPRWTPGLTLAADYYNIRIDNTILTGGVVSATSVDAVLLGCYGPSQIAYYCNLIKRNPAGTIIQVLSPNLNYGTARATGTDFELNYDTARAHLNLPGGGSLRFDVQMAVQYTNTQTNYQAPTSSFVGTWQQSNEAMIPRWKGIGTIDYLWNNWLFHWDTRYIEGTVSFDGTDETTPTMYYHDFSVAYTMKNMGPISNTRFVLGVNNLFDKNPPFLAGDSICKCNTLAGPYDVIGRFVYARADMHF